MKIFDEDQIHRLLDEGPLREHLRKAFRQEFQVPLRSHYPMAQEGQAQSFLLLMPAWRAGEAIGVKIVTVFPDNRERELPTVQALYILSDGATGQVQALMDGRALTLHRTAAASALAADYLARPDSRHLLMVGAGSLAPYMIRAHCSVRPIERVSIWNRTPERATRLARELTIDQVEIQAVTDLAHASQADIISCATTSHQPLIRGAWLQPGSHLDLVGAFTPEMRETDDEAVRRARLFVDTRSGALREAGDILSPLKRGVISEERIEGDLFDLARGRCRPRQSSQEITLFKSVGSAIEDLAAAQMVYSRGQETDRGPSLT